MSPDQRSPRRPDRTNGREGTWVEALAKADAVTRRATPRWSGEFGPPLCAKRSCPGHTEAAAVDDERASRSAVLPFDGSSAALCQSGQRGCCSLMLFSTCWLGSWREVRRRDCRPTRSDARHAALLVAGTTTLTSLGCGASTRWLNESVGGAASFFLVIVEAIWIGKSPPAPLFYVDHGPECRNPSGRRPEAGAGERHSGGLSGPPF
jgi:hypothetical protein